MRAEDIKLPTLEDTANSVIADIVELGMSEALGLAPLRRGMRVDPEKCLCGGGCESVLECEFWYYVRKTDAMERKAARQVKIGQFRVDALFDCGGKRVVVELDGAAYHNDRADWERDKQILPSVDAIVRIPYAAMHFYPRATFSVLASWYPRFAMRGVDLFCMTTAEFQDERRRMDYTNGDFQTEAQWLEWAEPNYELWNANGWVGSPRALVREWNVPVVRRFLSHERTFKPTRQLP